MMCAKSPVEEESTCHTEQLNLEGNSEVIKDLEEHLEAMPKQSCHFKTG